MIRIARHSDAAAIVAANPAAATSLVESRLPLQLWQIYVVPAFHGTGIAAELMTTVFEHARQHPHDVVWLGVSEHNARAIAFYRKHGFTPLGLHKVGTGHHEHEDVPMTCPVS